MAKFRNTKTASTTPKKTVNRAGGEAYKQNEKLELASILVTSLLKDDYYESSGERLERLANLVESIDDKKFVAKTAIYARNEHGLRSITHALLGELVENVKGEEWVKTAIQKTIFRPDDALETLSYYLNKYGSDHDKNPNKKRAIPNALKKGLALAVGKFDEYQLAKYRGGNSDMKMVDLFNLVHPKPTEKNAAAFKKLINDELKSTGANATWESKLSEAGKAGNAEEVENIKKESWKQLISEKKLGYLALLRNLNNIATQAPEVLGDALDMLKDEKMIAKSKVFPFQYLKAIKATGDQGESRKIHKGINAAIDKSLANVPLFDGKTLVVIDVSGSMHGDPVAHASLFGAALYKANVSADLMLFAERASYAKVDGEDSISSITNEIQKLATGGSTNFHDIFRVANKKYDRIIILSDMQGWVGHYTPTADFNAYCKKYDVKPYVYSFDVTGYGDMQLPEDKVLCIAGISDKIFDVMKLVEQDKNALINKINAIEL
jgi:hypothetical protein